MTTPNELRAGDRIEMFGVRYIIVSNEGQYTNSDGATYVDVYAKEIDRITGAGRGKRLLNLRVN
jgi:hypothetical protein